MAHRFKRRRTSRWRELKKVACAQHWVYLRLSTYIYSLFCFEFLCHKGLYGFLHHKGRISSLVTLSMVGFLQDSLSYMTWNSFFTGFLYHNGSVLGFSIGSDFSLGFSTIMAGFLYWFNPPVILSFWHFLSEIAVKFVIAGLILLVKLKLSVLYCGDIHF